MDYNRMKEILGGEDHVVTAPAASAYLKLPLVTFLERGYPWLFVGPENFTRYSIAEVVDHQIRNFRDPK